MAKAPDYRNAAPAGARDHQQEPFRSRSLCSRRAGPVPVAKRCSRNARCAAVSAAFCDSQSERLRPPKCPGAGVLAQEEARAGTRQHDGRQWKFRQPSATTQGRRKGRPERSLSLRLRQEIQKVRWIGSLTIEEETADSSTTLAGISSQPWLRRNPRDLRFLARYKPSRRKLSGSHQT